MGRRRRVIRRRSVRIRRGRIRRIIIIATSINIGDTKHDDKKRHMHTQTDALSHKKTWGNTNNNNDDNDTDDDNDNNNHEKQNKEG